MSDQSSGSAVHNIHMEIVRISGLESSRSVRGSGDVTDASTAERADSQLLQGGALPVSPPNTVAGTLIRVVVSDRSAKDELAARLHETKIQLLDLADRQLNDFDDANPSEPKDNEDIDSLLSDMRAVRRSMETVVALEKALNDS